MKYTNKIYRARNFADKAHNEVGQLRHYTNQPYIVHPIEVAEIVSTVPHDENMLIAALLHDTLEDTLVTLEDIKKEFGDDVAELVSDLTDVGKKEDGNRAYRTKLNREHSAKGSPRSQTIKLADLISNTKDIVKNDPDFAKTYMKEKELLLDVLKKGDKTLWNIAYERVLDYNRSNNA